MKGQHLLLGILALLIVSSSIAVTSSAYTNAPWSWTWRMSNGLTVKGNVESLVTIGTDYVTVTWIVPAYSYELFPNNKEMLTSVSITTIIDATGFIGIPQNRVSGSSNNAFVFTFVTETCSLHSCSAPHPFNIRFGDYVTVDINACYAYYECHGTTYQFQVKD